MDLFPTIYDSLSADARGRFICKIVELLGGCAVAWPPLRETPEDISYIVRIFLEQSKQFQTNFVYAYLTSSSRIVVSFDSSYAEFKKTVCSKVHDTVKECIFRGARQFWWGECQLWWPLQTKRDIAAAENVMTAWWMGDIGKAYRKDTETFCLDWRECRENYNFYFR